MPLMYPLPFTKKLAPFRFKSKVVFNLGLRVRDTEAFSNSVTPCFGNGWGHLHLMIV